MNPATLHSIFQSPRQCIVDDVQTRPEETAPILPVMRAIDEIYLILATWQSSLFQHHLRLQPSTTVIFV